MCYGGGGGEACFHVISSHLVLKLLRTVYSGINGQNIDFFCFVFIIEIGPENCSPRAVLWALESCTYEDMNKGMLVNVYYSYLVLSDEVAMFSCNSVYQYLCATFSLCKTIYSAIS